MTVLVAKVTLCLKAGMQEKEHRVSDVLAAIKRTSNKLEVIQAKLDDFRSMSRCCAAQT